MTNPASRQPEEYESSVGSVPIVLMPGFYGTRRELVAVVWSLPPGPVRRRIEELRRVDTLSDFRSLKCPNLVLY